MNHDHIPNVFIIANKLITVRRVALGSVGPFASLFLPSFLFLPRPLPAKRSFAPRSLRRCPQPQSLTLFEFRNAAWPARARPSSPKMHHRPPSLNWFDSALLVRLRSPNKLKYCRGFSGVERRSWRVTWRKNCSRLLGFRRRRLI